MIVSNWLDYRESLLPSWWLERGQHRGRSLRRSGPGILPSPPKN